MFKGLDAAPDMDAGPFDKMRRFLTRQLPAESLPAVRAAINTLFQVTHIRNGGQHVGAATQAAVALPALGLDFPITNHAAAWWIVQTHVINALDTIRVEANALSTTLQPARPAPAGTPGRRRSAHGDRLVRAQPAPRGQQPDRCRWTSRLDSSSPSASARRPGGLPGAGPPPPSASGTGRMVRRCGSQPGRRW